MQYFLFLRFISTKRDLNSARAHKAQNECDNKKEFILLLKPYMWPGVREVLQLQIAIAHVQSKKCVFR